MLDGLRFSVPFSSEFVIGAEGYAYISAQKAIDDGIKGEVNLKDTGVSLSARRIYQDEAFEWHHEELNHPFESLPSSNTDIAFKVFADGSGYPYVMLKASPANILQGHNVFGGDSIRTAAFEFLGVLRQSEPKLFSMLDIASTQVTSMDITYSKRFASERILFDVFDFMRGVSKGQTKIRKGVSYATTEYWGSEKSRLKVLKLYLKHIEFFDQLAVLRKSATRGDAGAKHILSIREDARLFEFVKYLARFEAVIKKRWLERRGISFNLFDLIAHQEKLALEGRCFLQECWSDATKELFSACEGQTMKIVDDDHILEALKANYFTMTPKGNVSHAKALRLFTFYRHLCEFGYSETQRVTPRKTLWRHIQDLKAIGLSDSYLQNIEPDRQVSNVIPVLRLVDVDFSNQRPDWYVEPVSLFDFSSYCKKVA
ncbi:MAG: hypothetical protein RJA86_1211 [Pseudomonadota bacterium]|jgi:II/X family phage/plasmid replication protein